MLQYSYNKNKKHEVKYIMGVSKFDNILLYLLEKARKSPFEDEIQSFEDGIDSLYFILFFPTIPLFIFCLVLLLGFTPNLDNILNVEKTMGRFFIGAILLAGFLILLNFLIKSRLRSIIKKHAYIESTKVEEKEVYNLDSEVNLNIRAETLGGEKTIISAKEPFSNKKLNNFRDKYIFIEASKEGETKIAYGGKAEILLVNEDEIAKLNIPKEALNYKVEKILLTKKVTQRVCDFLKEETTAFHTKIFLSASIDEDMLKEIKNQKELNDLLTL